MSKTDEKYYNENKQLFDIIKKRQEVLSSFKAINNEKNINQGEIQDARETRRVRNIETKQKSGLSATQRNRLRYIEEMGRRRQEGFRENETRTRSSNFDKQTRQIKILNEKYYNQDFGYKGIHLNLNYNGVPVEIQLQTENSLKLKIESDLFYEKYRSKTNLSDKEIFQKNIEQSNYIKKWNHLLDDNAFKALRAEVSSVYVPANSSSPVGLANSQPATGLVGLVQEPSTNSRNESFVNLNNRRVIVTSNNSTSSSSLSSESISQTRKNNNQRTYIEIVKDSASLRHNKVYNLKTINDLINNALTNIMNKFSNAKSVRIPNGKSNLINKSFKEINLAEDLDLAANNVANMIKESIIIFDNGVGNSIQQVKIGDFGHNEVLRKQSNIYAYISKQNCKDRHVIPKALTIFDF